MGIRKVMLLGAVAALGLAVATGAEAKEVK